MTIGADKNIEHLMASGIPFELKDTVNRIIDSLNNIDADGATAVSVTAVVTDLAAHIIDTSTHGVGLILGSTETQNISNKTTDDLAALADGTVLGATTVRFDAFLRYIKEVIGIGGANGKIIRLWTDGITPEALSALIIDIDAPGYILKDGLILYVPAVDYYERFPTCPLINCDMEDVVDTNGNDLRHWEYSVPGGWIDEQSTEQIYAVAHSWKLAEGLETPGTAYYFQRLKAERGREFQASIMVRVTNYGAGSAFLELYAQPTGISISKDSLSEATSDWVKLTVSGRLPAGETHLEVRWGLATASLTTAYFDHVVAERKGARRILE